MTGRESPAQARRRPGLFAAVGAVSALTFTLVYHWVRAGRWRRRPTAAALIGAMVGWAAGVPTAFIVPLAVRFAARILLGPRSQVVTHFGSFLSSGHLLLLGWSTLVGLAVGYIAGDTGRADEPVDLGPANWTAAITATLTGALDGILAGIHGSPDLPGIAAAGLLGALIGQVCGLVISPLAMGPYRLFSIAPTEDDALPGTATATPTGNSPASLAIPVCYVPAGERLLLAHTPLFLVLISIYALARYPWIAGLGGLAAVVSLRGLVLGPRLVVGEDDVVLRRWRRRSSLAWSQIRAALIDDDYWDLHLARRPADLGTPQTLTFPLLPLPPDERRELLSLVRARAGVGPLTPRALPTEARAARALAFAEERLRGGQLVNAGIHLGNGRALFEERDDPIGLAAAHLIRSELHLALGNPGEAQEAAETALRLATTSGAEEATPGRRRAAMPPRWPRAAPACQLLAQPPGALAGRAHVLLGRLLLAYFGDMDRAGEHAEAALRWSRVAEDAVGVALALELTGYLHAARGTWSQADRALRYARVAVSRADRSLAARQLLNQAEVALRHATDLERSGKMREAPAIWRQVVHRLREAERAGAHLEPSERSALALAQVSARQAVDRGLLSASSPEPAGRGPQLDVSFLTRYRRGLALFRSGQLIDAFSELEIALDHVEVLRRTLMTDWQKQRLLRDDRLAAYEAMVRLCLKLEQDRAGRDTLLARPLEEAFFYVERAKSRALLDLLEQSVSPAEQASAPWRRARDEDEFQSLQRTTSVPLHVLRTLIRPGTLVLEYFVGDNTFALLPWTREGLMPPWTRDGAYACRVKEATRHLLGTFGHPGEYGPATTEEQAVEVSKKLFRLLVPRGSEARRRLRLARELIVVPHGMLHNVPFCALHDGEQYLVDRLPVYQLPSASVIYYQYVRCKRRQLAGAHAGQAVALLPDGLGRETLACGADAPTVRRLAAEQDPSREPVVVWIPPDMDGGWTRDLLAVGSPDPALKAVELGFTEAVSGLDSERFGLLASVGATKQALLNALQEHRQRYIVVGTHIEAREDKATPNVATGGRRAPSGYQLLLDEPVSMNELYGFDLRCELLGLLGCDSGQVDVLPGDELVGLMRACLSAGAEQIVVTHWKVRVGAIREFIELLLPNLLSLPPGSDPWVAAVAARADLRRLPGREHPYYWALSFVGCPTV